MIFDLCGMPGAGKSTVSKEMEEYNINNVKDYYLETFFGKVYFHLFLYFFFLNPKLLIKYKKIMQIIGDSSNYKNSINHSIKISLYVKYLVFDYYLENKVKGNCIIDEGIIHYCIVLMVEFSLEKEKIIQIINLLKIDKINYVGLFLEKDECIKNIKKRNRKRCDMDFLNDEELDLLLRKWTASFEELSDYFKSFKKLELEEYIKNEIV